MCVVGAPLHTPAGEFVAGRGRVARHSGVRDDSESLWWRTTERPCGAPRILILLVYFKGVRMRNETMTVIAGFSLLGGRPRDGATGVTACDMVVLEQFVLVPVEGRIRHRFFSENLNGTVWSSELSTTRSRHESSTRPRSCQPLSGPCSKQSQSGCRHTPCDVLP